jgi:hypothetical protein
MVNLLAKSVIRIGVGVMIVAAVTLLANGYVPTASHKSLEANAKCTVSATTLGAAVPVTGSGFAPNTQYVLYTTAPSTSGGTTVTTGSTGSFTYGSMVAYMKGTYSASVWTAGHGAALAANCAPATVS